MCARSFVQRSGRPGHPDLGKDLEILLGDLEVVEVDLEVVEVELEVVEVELEVVEVELEVVEVELEVVEVELVVDEVELDVVEFEVGTAKFLAATAELSFIIATDSIISSKKRNASATSKLSVRATSSIQAASFLHFWKTQYTITFRGDFSGIAEKILVTRYQFKLPLQL